MKFTARLFFSSLALLASLPIFAQTPPAPPRSVADILAVLDQYKPDAAAIEKLRAQATTQPPDTKHEQELAVFYHRRSRAHRALGATSRQIPDLRKALELTEGNGPKLPGGLGDRSYILQDLAYAEQVGGNILRAVETHRKIAQMLGKRFGRTLYAWREVSNLSAQLGDIDAAREAASEANDTFSRLRATPEWSDYKHNRTLIVELLQADLLNSMGNFSEAERRYRNAILEADLDVQANASRLSRGLVTGPQSGALEMLATTEWRLSKNLLNQGRPAEAEAYARNAIFKYLQTTGRYSPGTAIAITNLGATIYEAGRFV